MVHMVKIKPISMLMTTVLLRKERRMSNEEGTCTTRTDPLAACPFTLSFPWHGMGSCREHRARNRRDVLLLLLCPKQGPHSLQWHYTQRGAAGQTCYCSMGIFHFSHSQPALEIHLHFDISQQKRVKDKALIWGKTFENTISKCLSIFPIAPSKQSGGHTNHMLKSSKQTSLRENRSISHEYSLLLCLLQTIHT